MNKTFHLQIWAAKCCGSEKNCLYPDAATVTDTETLKKVIANDHTFICFKDNYRSGLNFRYTDTLVTDCDNTHSEDPADWIAKEDIIRAFPDVEMLIYTSRNHMKPKDGKSPRPKYHIIFFIEREGSFSAIPAPTSGISRASSISPCFSMRIPSPEWTAKSARAAGTPLCSDARCVP